MTTPALTVYGIDVVASGVSTARVTGRGVPTCGYAAAPPSASWAPESMIASFDAFADRIVTGVLGGGLPDLIVMNKLTVDHQRADSSGPARAGLWWSIARHLITAGLPVAEAPPLFAAAKLFTNAVGGVSPSKIHTAAGPAAMKLWPGIKFPSAERFRPIAAVYAAAGVMALGGSTPIRLTDSRTRVLSMMRLPPIRVDETSTETEAEATKEAS